LRVLETALALFAERGYEATSIRDIARGAGVSIALVCQSFPTKEHFALALYERLANELSEWAMEMPAGTVAERFQAAARQKLALLEPHRRALVALAARAIDPEARASVLGKSTEIVRSKVAGVFWTAVSGASDAPDRDEAARLARLLYGAHLGLTLLFLQDADGRMASQALAMLGAALPALSASPIGAFAAQQIDGVFGHLFGTSAAASGNAEKARLILDRILRRRRVLPGTPAEPTEAARVLHLPAIEAFLDAGEPVQLALPAFPAKAPNPAKVLGKLPDLAESLALASLRSLLDEIGEAHAPGAELIICSDGHVFADEVGVDDADVAAYRRELERMIAEAGDARIRIFGLEDAFGTRSPAAARKMLLDAYAQPVTAIQERAKRSPIHAAQLDGIHRFLFEDEVVRSPSLSRTQARKLTRERAYEVVRRSDAWGQLVLAAFPRALRLSIHPQPDVSPKIGISLLATDDCWLTPWHGVAVLDGDRARLLHRADAEKLGAALVEENGRPTHMELPA
jgi:pyoverdine/dityrosine biosynthesis protein Dit1/AcrR family transcriptional regulator